MFNCVTIKIVFKSISSLEKKTGELFSLFSSLKLWYIRCSVIHKSTHTHTLNQPVWVVFRLRAPWDEVNVLKWRRRGERRGMYDSDLPLALALLLRLIHLHRLTEDLSTWLPSMYPTYLFPSQPCYTQHQQLGGAVCDPELIATLAAYIIRHPGDLNWLWPYFSPQARH